MFMKDIDSLENKTIYKGIGTLVLASSLLITPILGNVEQELTGTNATEVQASNVGSNSQTISSVERIKGNSLINQIKGSYYVPISQLVAE